MSDKEEIRARIKELEAHMAEPGFWDDKAHAQDVVARYQAAKDELEGVGKYDRGNAVVTIIAGAGGLDAEDFAKMLYEMYQKFAESKGYTTNVIHSSENDHGGYKSISFDVVGERAYATIKNESGVHRLVRLSPFNAKGKRSTSFVLVEVVPEIKEKGAVKLDESELDVQFAKSSGPGGQNANKRETAVRIVHEPTGIAVHVESERSQVANRERAMAILAGKLHRLEEENERRKLEGLSATKGTEIEWGSQIRSYVMHPYQMVKDHRTDTEVKDVEKVLDGELDELLIND